MRYAVTYIMVYVISSGATLIYVIHYEPELLPL